MDDRSKDEQARNRWAAIQAARAGGAIMAIVGLLIGEGVIPGPGWLGYLVLAVGLAGVFFVPTMLARKWRRPRP